MPRAGRLGTGKQHPVWELPPEHLEPINHMVEAVEQAKPERWEGRRRDFRRLGQDELWARRAGLLTASVLVSASVPFEFRERPDLVVDSALGIEVTSRKTHSRGGLADDLRLLESELRAIAARKKHQAAEMPTILLVDVTMTADTWLRPARVWKQRLLAMVDDLRPFVGVAIQTSSWDLAVPWDSAVAVRDAGALPPCWDDLRRAYGWT